MFIKICGITHPDDARAAVDAGADALGLNFVPTSRRWIDIQAAQSIIAVIPDNVMTVGIFRNQSVDEVLEMTGSLGLDAAQLHGDETPDMTAAVASGVELVIKALPATSPSLLSSIDEHAAHIVLLDAPVPGAGVTFNWDLVGDLVTKHRILLAGGLRPENVAEAVRRVRPWGVDVASGVEAASGRKDPQAIADFVDRSRAAERPAASG